MRLYPAIISVSLFCTDLCLIKSFGIRKFYETWLSDVVGIKAWEVEPSEHIPHGIRYSLTLHDRNNTRILGYDNAEAPPKSKHKPGRYGGKKVIFWDHKHQNSKVFGIPSVIPYDFETSLKLLEDFWEEVRKILRG